MLSLLFALIQWLNGDVEVFRISPPNLRRLSMRSSRNGGETADIRLVVAEPIGKLRVRDAVVMHLADQPSSP